MTSLIPTSKKRPLEIMVYFETYHRPERQTSLFNVRCKCEIIECFSCLMCVALYCAMIHVCGGAALLISLMFALPIRVADDWVGQDEPGPPSPSTPPSGSTFTNHKNKVHTWSRLFTCKIVAIVVSDHLGAPLWRIRTFLTWTQLGAMFAQLRRDQSPA